MGRSLNVGCDAEEILSIRSRQVCNASNLTLAPKQTVVVEFRDAIEVNRINGHHATFSEASKGGDDDVTAGCESYCPVEQNRRAAQFIAYPHPV